MTTDKTSEDLLREIQDLRARLAEAEAGTFIGSSAIARDFTAPIRAQDALQVSHRFLEIVHEQTEITPLLEGFVSEIKDFTGCEAVGIRVLGTAGEIPYLAYQGFSRQFYEMESPLSIHTDQCMCINVIKGTCDPALPFYTSGGSFYMNGTTRFLATVSEKDKGSTRNKCNQEGYESVALVPFRRGDSILGLIHVADHRENMVPLHVVEMLEKVGMQLGAAFQKLQAEKSLRESETRYRTLVENIDLGISIIDSDHRIIMTNAAQGRLLQRPLGELVGHECFREFEHRDAVCAHCPGTKAMATGQKEVLELPHTRPDGSRLDVRIQAFPYRAADGQITGFIEVVEDITQRKEIEEALQQNEELYRSLFENMLNGFAYCKMLFHQNQPQDFIYLKVNHSFELLTGLKDVEGKKVSEVIPGIREADPELFEIYGRVALTGKPEKFETYVASLKMWFSISIYSPAKEYFVAVFDVITERKQMEEELRSAAHAWQSTFDAISDAVCLVDRESQILQCNQAMAALTAKPVSEIIGHHCCQAVPLTTGSNAECPVGCMLKSRRRETQTLPFGDRWLHVMADPILNKAGEVAGGVLIIADISHYKRTEARVLDLNILLGAIKDINEVLLRVKNEKELFQKVCDLLKNVPYVRFAWIGLVQPDTFEVKPAAWAGHEDGYLSIIKTTWDDSPYAQGPIGMAIKTGKPGIVEDIENDPIFSPWRQDAELRGYASCIALPLVYDHTTLGSLNVYAEKKNAFQAEEVEFLQQVAGDIAVGIRSLRLEQELIQGLIKFQIMMIQTVEAIATMAEMRDPYTAGHQRNVTRLACDLALKIGLADSRIEGIRVAGFLHDIGKIVVPVEILNKPGKLSQYEFNLIKTHSQAGHDILQKIDFPWPVAEIVLQHHERLNGSGYPRGLTGSDILLEAKILAVADVMEAMAAHRPYRPSLGVDKALEEITRNQETLYDPQVVEACVRLFTKGGFHF
jgi:PAS domain S-box-containing protein/putative nucleotidyltransferase with HDIG domain